MKKFILFVLLSLPLFLSAQEKPGKIRIENGFLSTKYEIGDKTTPAKEIALHLKKTEPDAYIKWKLADKASTNAVIWTVIGSAGMLVGLIAKDSGVKVAGYSAGAIGYTVSLVAVLNEGNRRQKAIDIYNNKFGY